MIELQIDGQKVTVPEGTTLMEAASTLGISTPTLCWAPNLDPATACRVCVVEVEGSRVLVPACGRKAEAGMVVHTNSKRVRTSRKMVLELLGSSVDLSAADQVKPWMAELGADPARMGPAAAPSPAGERDAARAGHHHATDGATAATVCQPIKVDNELYVRDYGKCILCYKCVDACGEQAQGSFAIAVAGRGFDARISTELDKPLTDSACVYCGNCIGVCPTGALQPVTEHELREQGAWAPERQTQTDTICPYCGVGCTLRLHVQDDRIVKVSSPHEVSVTGGHLCIKGRFGTRFVAPKSS
ncbi:MAG: (2Fe-2S)-binding protein [Myxococcales bacterium]|nr:(2Fe-2S)-binding protein [Myxococcales bacterium]